MVSTFYMAAKFLMPLFWDPGQYLSRATKQALQQATHFTDGQPMMKQ